MIHIDISPLGVDKIEIDDDVLFEINMREVWPLVKDAIQKINKTLRIKGTREMLLLERVVEVKDELRKKNKN